MKELHLPSAQSEVARGIMETFGLKLYVSILSRIMDHKLRRVYITLYSGLRLKTKDQGPVHK